MIYLENNLECQSGLFKYFQMEILEFFRRPERPIRLM